MFKRWEHHERLSPISGKGSNRKCPPGKRNFMYDWSRNGRYLFTYYREGMRYPEPYHLP